MLMKFLKVNPKVVFIFIFTVWTGAAWARDEKSIKELRDALVALAPDVDPGEAELLSVTVHNTARSLAREYRMTGDPAFHNFLINIGERQRGYCAHFARDIGTRLKQLNFTTLVLHWGAAYAPTADESNCLVATARNQPFLDGIVLDAWRHAGRLFWCPIRKDYEYELGQHITQFGRAPHSGITAWKEDMQETAWLQNVQPRKTEKPKRTTARH